jgi:hypothetical protein
MTTPDQIIEKMEVVLDALVSNAEDLKNSALQAISETELDVLQKKQENLVEELKKLQTQFQASASHAHLDPTSPITQRIIGKLQIFQQLNAAFIENLNSNRGIIKFEKKHLS